LDLNSPNNPRTGFTATFLAGEAAVSIADLSMTIIDQASTTLIRATATLANRPDGAAEVLAVSTAGTSIQANYANGVLTLSGVDSLEHYQQVLASATYGNTASKPDISDRTISITVNDGTSASAPVLASVHIGAEP